MKILKAKLHLNVAENGRDSILLFSKDLVNKAAKLGYDGLDISFDDAEFTIAELDELKKYADKRNINLVRASEDKYSKHPITEEERNKIKTFEDIRSNIGKADKKGLVIKEISKVLTEIEDSKKTKRIIYFSSLQNRKVYDANGDYTGKLKDLVISGGERFPEVSHILLVHKKTRVLVPWAHVFEWGKHTKLNLTYEQLPTRELREDDVLLGDNILDMQVVDVNGLKVIRVNDIALTYIKGKLAVVSIDVGTRSIIRRLGFEKVIDLLHINVKNHPVPWNSVEPLTGSVEKIHLKVPCPRVSNLHPADVADLFDELSLRERHTILKSMSNEIAAKVLLECDRDVRKSILDSMKTRRIISILDKMSPNDAASILSEYPIDEVTMMLKKMNLESATRLEEVLSYNPGTVARYMDHVFVTVPQTLTVEQAMAHIRSLKKYPYNFNYVYTIDENEVLFGVVSLKNLIIAEPSNLLKDIMVTKVVTVDMSHPIGYVKELITKHDLLSLPVIDVNGRLKGVVDIAKVLDVVLDQVPVAEPLELTADQKETLNKNQRLKKYYSSIVKDIGKFMKDLESIKPKKKDYLEHMSKGIFGGDSKQLKKDIVEEKDKKDKDIARGDKEVDKKERGNDKIENDKREKDNLVKKDREVDKKDIDKKDTDKKDTDKKDKDVDVKNTISDTEKQVK
ncbi:MAG: magnesium transporter MgtE N-terminal domain-containing protein [Candidatus Woesearchaeota archaeon]